MSANPIESLEIIKNRLRLSCQNCRVFDIVIVDMEMPFMDGDELASKIREIVEYEKVPIICSSANEVAKKRSKYFTATMTKPISSSDVERITSRFLKDKVKNICDCPSNRSLIEKYRTVRNFLSPGDSTWRLT